MSSKGGDCDEFFGSNGQSNVIEFINDLDDFYEGNEYIIGDHGIEIPFDPKCDDIQITRTAICIAKRDGDLVAHNKVIIVKAMCGMYTDVDDRWLRALLAVTNYLEQDGDTVKLSIYVLYENLKLLIDKMSAFSDKCVIDVNVFSAPAGFTLPIIDANKRALSCVIWNNHSNFSIMAKGYVHHENAPSEQDRKAMAEAHKLAEETRDHVLSKYGMRSVRAELTVGFYPQGSDAFVVHDRSNDDDDDNGLPNTVCLFATPNRNFAVVFRNEPSRDAPEDVFQIALSMYCRIYIAKNSRMSHFVVCNHVTGEQMVLKNKDSLENFMKKRSDCPAFFNDATFLLV